MLGPVGVSLLVSEPFGIGLGHDDASGWLRWFDLVEQRPDVLYQNAPQRSLVRVGHGHARLFGHGAGDRDEVLVDGDGGLLAGHRTQCATRRRRPRRLRSVPSGPSPS